MHTRTSPSKRIFLALAPIVVLLVLLIGVAPIVAQDFGQPTQGQHVYDRTGLLTSEELAMLEERATAVEQAGAPVVVYLQEEEADFDETLEDGRELMEAWDVQSAADARDGVVIFLNLEPDDLRHGQLALVAGESHFDGGNLPQYQMDRITSEMREILGDEETAEGIATGLEMVTDSLVNGPPPPPEPSQFEKTAADLSSGIFSVVNVVAVLVTAALAFIGTRIWRTRPVSNSPAPATTTPPGDLMPAAAGALVTGRINDMQMEATILDLAGRGALALEPADDKKKVQLRLLDDSLLQNEYERQVWNALESESEDDGLITDKKLSKVRSHWGPAKEALRSGLEARGWYNPDAGRRRIPLYIAGSVAIVLAIIAFILSAVGAQVWGMIGAGLLAASGLTVFMTGFAYPDTTSEGESQAQPWRGYLQGLKDAKKDTSVDLDLDQAVPYAVAMNARTELDKRLKSASEEGYAPLWLGRSPAHETWGAVGFYPYWATFHTSVSPTAGAGTGGGAAAGSGGSGGGF